MKFVNYPIAKDSQKMPTSYLVFTKMLTMKFIPEGCMDGWSMNGESKPRLGANKLSGAPPGRGSVSESC